MIVPIFEIDAATDDPTVNAGSGRRCVTRTTSLLSVEAVATMGFAARFAAGRGSGEFGGPFAYAMFAAIISTPYCLGALMGMVVPATVLLKTFRSSLTVP